MIPVFLFQDDADHSITAGDELHASTCRYTQTSVVYCTQSINNIISVLGEPASMALMASLRNRIVCRTEDEKTIAWLLGSVGQRISDDMPFGPEAMSDPELRAKALRELKQGGPGGVVEAVVIRGNDTFKVSGRRWLKVSFRQGGKKKKTKLGRLWEYLTSPHVRIVPKGPKGE